MNHLLSSDVQYHDFISVITTNYRMRNIIKLLFKENEEFI